MAAASVLGPYLSKVSHLDIFVNASTPGVRVRFEHGLIDQDGNGYHGLIGLDVDGNGTADYTTYIVGPNGELPDPAQWNGSPDHGVVNICTVAPLICQ